MSITWTATMFVDDVGEEDHAATAAEVLLWQYWPADRVNAVLEVFMDDLQSIEDLQFQVLSETGIFTAIGTQLDTIGDIVLQDRQGLLDPAYRVFLLGRIYVNRADGQLPQYSEILVITGHEETIHIDEHWPAALRVSATSVVYPAVVENLIRDMKGGGIALLFVYSEHPDAETFQCSAVLGTDDTDAATGLGDLAETVGGYLSGGYV